MKEYIKGSYRGSIFQSDQGYTIGMFKVKDTNDDSLKDYINKTITFTGYFFDLNEDDTYFLYGELINHPKYGLQYQVSEYERVKPDDKDGIIQFLASSLFPGIGDKMAEKIVETLGNNTLNRILSEPECLNLVPKLSQKKAIQIHDILTKYEESHKTIVYLTELGFNMKDSLNIYHSYLSNTITIIEHNIFRLLDDIDNISFTKLDEIGKKLNMLPDDQRRIQACIIYVMKNLTFQNGDTYLYYDDIKDSVNKYLNLEIRNEDFNDYLEELKIDNKIVIEDNKYFIKNINDAENNIVNKIKYLNNAEKIKFPVLDNRIESLEKSLDITYNSKQKEAIKKALTNRILIITGGPGTGKTTIVKAIVELYQQLNKINYDKLLEKIALLAPTGRASKRMSDSTLLPAMTIHRFLKWNKETNQFEINEFCTDKSEFIIIDEVSMIDTELMDSLLKGLSSNIQLILVGDYNQLPSVGCGQILKDLIESEVIDTVHLDLLYRQDENSYITTLAHEIKDENLNENFLQLKSDYQFLQCSSNSIRNNLNALATQILNKGYDYKRVQFMAPMYRGVNGIDNLNKELQFIFNPKDIEKQEVNFGDIIFREQDKLLQLVNMPEDNVYNGDIGIIETIIEASKSKSKKTEIYVNFDGNVVKYLPKDFVKLKHAYVISIHKSQGSEFELVVMPISYSYKRMLYKKLIYTGITRAKRKLILIGEPNVFVEAIKTNEEYNRKTTLKEKLQNTYK